MSVPRLPADETPLDPSLRIQIGQQNLTSVQKAAAKRFASEYIQTQRGTGPVDEPEAEALLRQAYTIAGLPPPQAIHWLDSPAQFAWNFIPGHSDAQRFSVWDDAHHKLLDNVHELVEDRTQAQVLEIIGRSVRRGLRQTVENLVSHSVRQRLVPLGAIVRGIIYDSQWKAMWESVEPRLRTHLKNDLWMSAMGGAGWSTRSYYYAETLASFSYFHVHLAPNDLHPLIRFNQLVSGYWLGHDKALVVRRPRLLVFDDRADRLHNAVGKCIEYPDGWGGYAWHGVRVPKKVILAPETLNRDDWERQPGLEARRIIQERMGQRFVSTVGGQMIDSGPRGTLYRIGLDFRDRERIAQYVQVQDVSSARQYYLRVPPTIKTAAEAVAWSFGMPAEDYHPTQES